MDMVRNKNGKGSVCKEGKSAKGDLLCLGGWRSAAHVTCQELPVCPRGPGKSGELLPLGSA